MLIGVTGACIANEVTRARVYHMCSNRVDARASNIESMSIVVWSRWSSLLQQIIIFILVIACATILIVIRNIISGRLAVSRSLA